jgi:4-amino-4-deoxy-L-arabinose transferase-like glycosyltransferase
VLSLFWAFYYNGYQELVQLMTEPFTCLLITLILFCLIKLFQNENPKSVRKYILFSGACIGYLALTKISFGYVLMFLLVGSISILIFNKRNSNLKKLVIVLLTALVFTTPYLIYTFNLTGKIFYWGTPGGDSLYWMSTPFENEYGNWYGDFNLLPRSQKEIESNIPGYLDSLKLHHQKDYDKIFAYEGVLKREKMFKKIAIENIKSNPLKYLDNCISNAGRLLFSFPYSYTIQSNRTLFRLPLNGALVLISIFSLIPTLFNWKKLFFPIKFILFFLFLYLGASVLVSSTIRMFTIIVPMLLFWIGYVLQRTVKLNLSFTDKE